jgi:hypothetical protein
MIFCEIYNLYNNTCLSLQDIVNFIEINNDINLHGHINLNKEAGKALGLGASMVGVAAAVSKAVAKSGMPPLQKVGVVLGSSLISGLAHSKLSTMDSADTAFTSNTVNNTIVNKFLNDSHVSPLQDLLFNGEMMSYVCLSLIYIVIIQLIFKLYFKDTLNLNFINILSDNIKKKLEYYLNKIIKLNKQMSIL